jgi:hypothetical protein
MVDLEKPSNGPQIHETYGSTVITRPGVSRGISWGAIFAGAVLATVTSVVLNLLGLGIGAVSLQPGARNAGGIGIGAGVWLIVANLIALYVGGWAAGKLSNSRRRSEGVLHGLITWGFVTIFAVYLVGNVVGALVGGTANMASQVLPQAQQQMSPADRRAAERRLNQLQSQGQAGRQGEQAADVAGGTSIVAAIALILGGFVAGIGGAVAAKRNRERAFPHDDRHVSVS